MLKLLTSSFRQGFCLNNRLSRIYDLTFQIKDVTMMRGMLTPTPYFYLQKQKVQVPLDKLIFEVVTSSPENMMGFLDRDMNVYHPTTPLSIVCSEPFFVRKKANIYCILNNLPLVTLSDNPDLKISGASKVIQSVCKDSIHDLPDDQNQQVSWIDIHNTMVTNLLRHGMQFKIQKIRHKQILKVVNRQIQIFQNQIKELEYNIKRKANRTLRNYTTFLLLQYGVMHYYIYHHLSWDIMEPITVIFANFDLFVGYLFFVLRGRDWSLGEMHGNYIDQRKYANLKKNGINVQKYDELLRIREYLNLRLALLSKNPYELMQALSKPIKMLDTR